MTFECGSCTRHETCSALGESHQARSSLYRNGNVRAETIKEKCCRCWIEVDRRQIDPRVAEALLEKTFADCQIKSRESPSLEIHHENGDQQKRG